MDQGKKWSYGSTSTPSWSKVVNRRGFTLIEIICVTVILGILGALLTPVFVQARQTALVARSTDNMRQWHVAFTLYADDTPESNINQIHYPLSLRGIQEKSKMPESMLGTGGQALPGLGRAVYTYMVATDSTLSSRWQSHMDATDGNPIILVDDTHNPGVDYKGNPFILKFGLGLFYDGHVEHKSTTGNFGLYETWEKK